MQALASSVLHRSAVEKLKTIESKPVILKGQRIQAYSSCQYRELE